MPLAELIAQGTLLSGVVLPGYALFYAWRARRRNRRERCGHCGGPQYVSGLLEGPSLVQGILVCARCAARLRRRYQLALAAVIGVCGLALTAGVTAWALEPGVMGPLMLAAMGVEYGGFFGGTLWWMRRRNRRKLQEMVEAGELPAGASPLLRDR